MSSQRNETTLCAHTPDPLWKDLESRLRGLGYEVAMRLGLDEVLHAFQKPSRPPVLLLESAPVSRDFARRVLGTAKTPCALAVLEGQVMDYERALLERCLDFLVLPAADGELAARMERACARFEPLTQPCGTGPRMEALAALNLIGESPAFLRATTAIRLASCCDATALINGETGTGKELAARAIHYLGPRRQNPFIPVNCGAIPDHLLENELFGHERGAYTDARTRHTGLVEQANRGTLFLDEVDALSDKAQVALLRFLQDLRYRPLGASESRVTDVRIIAATNAPLSGLVNAGRFRRDLWYRLDLFEVSMPPLRERPGDIQLLATHFLRGLNRRYDGAPAKLFAPEFLGFLAGHDWPGNVRELENAVHRAYLMAEGDLVSIPLQDDRPVPAGAATFRDAKARAVTGFEREYLQELMQRAGGNVSSAARLAGMERRALGKLLKKHGIDRRRYVALA